jgi:hypothetical protein
MKYLKTYKLFEALVEDVAFIRMSHVDMLDGKEEGWYSPGNRRMIGPDSFNDCLVKAGFPDKQKCVHFMSESSYDPGYGNVYGKNIFQVIVDDKSKLGWCFVTPINNWFYKGHHILNALGKNELVDEIMKSPFADINTNPDSYDDDGELDSDDSEFQQRLDEALKYMLDFGVIGTGTIDDLKKSPHYGKYNLYVWTNDKVYIKKYVIKTKEKEVESKPYKKQILVTKDDFDSLGVDKDKIGIFYNSPEGRKMLKIKEDLPYNMKREEALRLLKIWSENL